MTPPPRGFAEPEYRARTTAAQALMAEASLAALLLTTEPEVRYFTGFLTRFWESPTRPWFVIVPASGLPVAVIPAIGSALMRRGWIDDVRTWPAPAPPDDGIPLLAGTLRELVPKGGRIGVPDGPETHLRLPLADWASLRHALGRRPLTGDAGVVRRLRLVKSPAEIAKIRHACAIAGRAFARVPEHARPGVSLEAVFRRFQIDALTAGADWVPYLAGGAGPGGYADVISPAGPHPLAGGDVLMLDTGLVHDGYFCDYDRNWAIGAADDRAAAAHARLVEAAHAGFDAARPGVEAAALFHAMDRVLSGAGSGSTGRLGHGLGMQLTEWPSLMPADRTLLAPGMVLTLEPALDCGPGRMLVHEENIEITATGARWLTEPAGPSLPVIG